MTVRPMLFGAAGNPIVWAIVGLAIFCYVLEFNLILSPRDAQWKHQAGIWLKVLPVLLSALPLLGLLGTIIGLLTTFHAMARADGSLDQQTLLSSGIAAALITTQLGLITVIPGSLLCAFIRRRHRDLG